MSNSLGKLNSSPKFRSPYDDDVPISPPRNDTPSHTESGPRDDDEFYGAPQPTSTSEAPVNGTSQEPEQEEEEEEEEEVDLGDESDEDVEIIMDAAPRSLDFRQGPGGRAPAPRTTSTSIPTQPRGAGVAQPLLTTEYTPMPRGGPPDAAQQATAGSMQAQLQPQPAGPSFAGLSSSTPVPQSQAPATQPPEGGTQLKTELNDGVDTSTLPAVSAPPSHPAIDPTATGVLDGRSIIDVDLGAMVDKPWRRPGSDISDWFNYGFDEISWEAYCYRRRDLGELANVLKTNVINFAGMQEEQLTALPPEVRQMVMTGTTAMMNGAANSGMMGPGVMMDMSGMMGPMGMGIDMGMGGGMMQMQPDGSGQMQQGVGSGTPEQSGQGNIGMMQDGAFNGQQQGDMMGIGMGDEYGMQQPTQMGQPMYQGMDGPQPVAAPVPVPGGGRGAAPVAYRGRGAQGMVRGRGFPGRGRGRGGFGGDVPPPVPVRPASPLPPGVPTGPRNQNKYKDRDGNAPAVDGLDYGGTNKDGMGRTSSGEPDERSMSRDSRKRRSSPGLDEGRNSKRR
ncbi:hypothetical protein H0H87_009975 [Tephrocybe sp. NHM501043]|nr:hypothetical protein H0H87_009975 [Tephrocybe sp. NHM501043]